MRNLERHTLVAQVDLACGQVCRMARLYLLYTCSFIGSRSSPLSSFAEARPLQEAPQVLLFDDLVNFKKSM